MRMFSYGGGIQSTACLVLAAEGKIDYPLFVFANVGDDSEHPATIRYIREVAAPYAEDNGIELREITGNRGTLYSNLMGDNRSVSFPVYMSNGAPGNRTCTSGWKIRPIARLQKKLGATADNPCVTGLGISVDEVQRARTNSGFDWQVLEYPLLDLRINRASCVGIIERAGLPVPPKSACWFCPFQSIRRWQELRRNEPELWGKAVALEHRINDKRDALGRDVVYVTRKLIPLEDAIPLDGNQLDLFDDDVCDSGYCFV